MHALAFALNWDPELHGLVVVALALLLLPGTVYLLLATNLGARVGFILAVAGFFGGRVDTLLMRVTDVFLALPALPLLLMVTYLFRDPLKRAFGPELGVFLLIVGVIGAINWMPLARLVRHLRS